MAKHVRVIVKARIVAGCVVVTLPKLLLGAAGIEPGDRVIVAGSNTPGRLLLQKEPG